jgi:NAD(P)H dehydrogenase (quinone)
MNRHLVVKALHRDKSFLSRGADKLTERLIENNEEVVVRDLYELNFNPVLTITDFESLEEGNIPVDIEREQIFIDQSDYIWFVFPIWWINMPAILKGCF